MKKGEQLIWDLFLMVREIAVAAGANTAEFAKRQNEWAKKLNEMAPDEAPAPAGAAPAPEETVDPADHPAGMRAKHSGKK